MNNATPWTSDNRFTATPLWLFYLTGFRRTERDVWRAGHGARKYVVKYWVFWVFNVYDDCRVFGSCDW